MSQLVYHDFTRDLIVERSAGARSDRLVPGSIVRRVVSDGKAAVGPGRTLGLVVFHDGVTVGIVWSGDYRT